MKMCVHTIHLICFESMWQDALLMQSWQFFKEITLNIEYLKGYHRIQGKFLWCHSGLICKHNLSNNIFTAVCFILLKE